MNIVANAQFQQVYAEVAKLKEAMLSLQKASVGGPFSQSQTAIIKSAQSAFDSAVLSTRAFTVEHVKMTDSIAKFGKELNAGKLSLSNYYKIWRDSAKGVSAELDALATNQARLNRSMAIADPLRPGYAKLVTDINGVVTAQEKQIFYQKALNTALQQGSMKLIDFGKNTQWMGRQLTVGLTMPLAMFGATASTVFLNVDKELTRLMKVYGTGLTQPTHQALMQIRGDILGLGNDLAKSLGISVQETAAMAADLAATGQTGSNLINATREALRLATLGELDHQQAMQATISLQNVYKLSTQGLSEAVNFLNAVENQTSTSLQDLVDAIPRVGPIVAQLGGSFKDTAAMMVAMKEAGVPAAQSANAIKSAIASLINPTKNAQNAFAAYHINLKQIASTAGGNPVKMIVALQESMQKLEPLAKAQLIEKLFGKFQQARIQALIDNLGKAGSQTQTVFQLMGASSKDLANLAAQELKTQTESASGRFKRMLETVKADLIPVGQAFLNSFSRLGFILDKVVKAFQTIGHVLGPISGLLGKVFGTGLAGLIVIGPVIMLTGLFANLIGNILRGVNSLRMFKQGMDAATSGENKFMAGLHGMRNFYEDLDKSAIAARNQIELMPEAITTNAKAFETLRKAIFDLTIQFEALAAAQRAAATAAPMAAEGAAASTILSQMRIPGFASGGRVPGSGNTDSVPAMLTPGESIVTKSATAKYGPIIDAMNRGTLPGFIDGVTGVKSRSIIDETVIKGWGNATMFLPEKMNQDLSKSGVSASILSDQIAKQGASTYASLMTSMAREMGLKMSEFGPQFKEVATAFAHQTTSILQEAAQNGVIVNDEWIAANVIPKLKETASIMQIAGKEVGVALDTVVNEIKTAGVKGISGGGSGGEGRFAIPGLGSYKSLRTKAQSLAKEWDENGIFDYKTRWSDTRKKIISEFKVLNTQSQEYQNAVMAHLGQGVDMTFGKMKEAVAKAGGNVSKFVHGFLLRFDTSYRQGIKEATQSQSPSKIGQEAGLNMGQGVSKGVLDARNVVLATEAGASLAAAEVAGHSTGTTTFLGMPGMGAPETEAMTRFGRLRAIAQSPMGGMGIMMAGSMLANYIPSQIGGQSISGFKGAVSAGMSAGGMAMMIPGLQEFAVAIGVGAFAIKGFASLMKSLNDEEKRRSNALTEEFSAGVTAAKYFNVAVDNLSSIHLTKASTNAKNLADSMKKNQEQVDALTLAYKNATDQVTKDTLNQVGKLNGNALADYMQNKFATDLASGMSAEQAKQDVNALLRASGKSNISTLGLTLPSISTSAQGFQTQIGAAMNMQGGGNVLTDIFTGGITGVNTQAGKALGAALTNLSMTKPSNFKDALSGLDAINGAAVQSEDAFLQFRDSIQSLNPDLAKMVTELHKAGVENTTLGQAVSLVNAGMINSETAFKNAATSLSYLTTLMGAYGVISSLPNTPTTTTTTGTAGTDAQKLIDSKQKLIDQINEEKAKRDQLYNAQLKNIEAQQAEMNLQADIVRARGAGDLIGMATAQRNLTIQRTKDAMDKAKTAADNADAARIAALEAEIKDLKKKQDAATGTAGKTVTTPGVADQVTAWLKDATAQAENNVTGFINGMADAYKQLLAKHLTPAQISKLFEAAIAAMSPKDFAANFQAIYDNLIKTVGLNLANATIAGDIHIEMSKIQLKGLTPEQVSKFADDVYAVILKVEAKDDPATKKKVNEAYMTFFNGLMEDSKKGLQGADLIAEVQKQTKALADAVFNADKLSKDPKVRAKAQSDYDAIMSGIGDAAIKDFGDATKNSSQIQSIKTAIINTIKAIISLVGDVIQTVWDKVMGALLSGLRSLNPVNLLKALAGGFSSFARAVTGFKDGGIIHAANGLMVGPGGPKSDMIPAMLSNGEFVVQADAVSKYGIPLMNAINNKSFNVPTSRLGTYTAGALSDTIANATNYGGNTINVYPPQGADAQQVANMVIRQLDLAKQKQQTMRRVGNG